MQTRRGAVKGRAQPVGCLYTNMHRENPKFWKEALVTLLQSRRGMNTTSAPAPRPSLPSALARSVALLALVLGATGCPSFATRGSARTLNAGKWETHAGMGFTLSNPLAPPSSRDDENGAVEYSGDDAYVTWELGAAFGLTDRVELGGRLITPSHHNALETASLFPALALDAKVQLSRSDEPGQGLNVAIDPTVTVASNPTNTSKKLTSYVQLPLLMGIHVSERNEVLLSPQLMVAMPHLGLTSRQLIPSLGVAYLHRFESGWGLRPELTAIVSPDPDGTPFSHTTFQAGLAVLKR